MKLIIVILIVQLLMGCALLQSGKIQDDGDSNMLHIEENLNGESQSAFNKKSESVVTQLSPDFESQVSTTLSRLLLERDEYCQLAKEEKSDRINQLSKVDSTEANIELLILASCKPHMTPGIMRNALVRLKKKTELPKEYQSFFSIMMAQLNASEQIARQQQALIDQLNTTVEELTKIEKDIESRDSQNKAMEPFSP